MFNTIRQFNQSLMDGYYKIWNHQHDMLEANAAIDAASPFGPVATTFSRDSDDLPVSPSANTGAMLLGVGMPGVQYALMDGLEAGEALAERVASSFQGVGTKISDALGSLGDLFDRPSSASGVSGAQLHPETLDYLNADLARSYGMDRTTAYQEALSNTSYQRAVKDMQAAGLNPASLFGNGRVSGAGGVAYASPAGSGRSGGFGGKSGSAKLFSEGAYAGISTAAGIAAAAITGNVYNYWLGSTAAKGVMTAMNGLDKAFG